jgi:hypothetical protein
MIDEMLAKYPFPMLRGKTDVAIMLQFNYGIMLASENLLKEAGMDDIEERGHAEWLKEDMIRLGIEIPLYDYAAATIAGAQYYYIRHVHPMVLLGYRAALECRPMSIESVNMLEKEMGLMPCLRYHAIHDVDHGRQIIEQIEAITDTWLLGYIYYNAECTAQAIYTIFHMRMSAIPEESYA